MVKRRRSGASLLHFFIVVAFDQGDTYRQVLKLKAADKRNAAQHAGPNPDYWPDLAALDGPNMSLKSGVKRTAAQGTGPNPVSWPDLTALDTPNLEADFMERLSDLLRQNVTYQRQPKIYYSVTGFEKKYRRPGAVRCEPSFTMPLEDEFDIERETQCEKLAILLHGFTSCPGMWASLQPRLAATGFCVLRPTLPGHGYQPTEGSISVVKLTIDKTTWSKMNKLSDGQVFRPNEEYKFYTGLRVEEQSRDADPRCKAAAIQVLEKGMVCYIVKDVKQGKFYEFNTLVAQFEVGGNLDMILPGDVITSIKPYAIGGAYRTAVDHMGELYFLYPEPATRYWNSSSNYIEIEIQRRGFEENLIDLPTSNTWHAYVDFAERLSKFAAAFRRLKPYGLIAMMGHSLGAVTATAAMVHAAVGEIGRLRVFDRVLLLNPAFGVDPSYGWALKTVGAWLPFAIDNAKCQRTRRTLSTGGYCKYSVDHVRAVHEFGRYALCSLLMASDHLDAKDPPFWCRDSFKQLPVPSLLPSVLHGALPPLSEDIEMVSTDGDPAIYNGHFQLAANKVRERLGRDRVGFCYLERELGHSFLNELDSTKKRDFWWNPILHHYIEDFFNQATKFPVQKSPSEKMCFLDQDVYADV